MIEVRDLHCGYGSGDVLRGVSLDLARGESAALLGPNGCGKTTLILALSGVLRPRLGSVRIDGGDVSELAPRRRARRVAAVPQRPGDPPELSVFSMVLMGRYPYVSMLSGYGPADREAAAGALAETGAEALAHRRAPELSGGEFQRVLIARALAQAAGLLLLDEAASGLDVARKVEIHDLLAEKNRRGLTILSAVHDLNLAALYCGRLIFMKHGRVVLDGPPREVFTEEKLSAVYETRIKVSGHPLTGAPQALLVPGGPAAAP